MNRQLSTQEINELSSAIYPMSGGSLVARAPVMTRRHKLLHWAKLVRDHPAPLKLYHGLEDEPVHVWDTFGVGGTAFGLAFDDPTFVAAGLEKVGPHTLGRAARFLELTRDDMHPFSCDCGGHIDNDKMADCIEKIADGRNIVSRAFHRLRG